MTSSKGDLVGPIETRSGYAILKINEIEDLRAKDIPTIPTTVGDEKELNIFFQADQDNIKSLLSKDFLTDEEAFKIMRSAKDVF
jgi:hydroxyacylglutathione hydrolase